MKEDSGIEITDEIVKKKNEIYLKEIRRLGESVFFPGFRDVIKAAKSRFKIGIVSGSTEQGIRKVLPPEMANTFDVIVGDDGRLKSKPDSEMLLLASERLGIDPKEAAYVGDVEMDMIAAKKAGMKAIGVYQSICSRKVLQASGADITIRKIRDIINILDKL